MAAFGDAKLRTVWTITCSVVFIAFLSLVLAILFKAIPPPFEGILLFLLNVYLFLVKRVHCAPNKPIQCNEPLQTLDSGRLWNISHCPSLTCSILAWGRLSVRIKWRLVRDNSSINCILPQDMWRWSMRCAECSHVYLHYNRQLPLHLLVIKCEAGPRVAQSIPLWDDWAL